MRQKAFTLIEIFVVIMIITILVALLVPAIKAARAKAQKMKEEQEKERVEKVEEEARAKTYIPSGHKAYEVLLKCSNCSQTHKMQYVFGTEVQLEHPCPHCGVTGKIVLANK